MQFDYLWQMPKRWTFEQPKLRLWVESFCQGKVLNLFAGKTRLSVNEFRVDVSAEFKPDLICEAFNFVRHTDTLFDSVILDPPYNVRQARENYNGRCIGCLTKLKNEIPRILRPGGIVISLGYDSVGMCAKRAFDKIALCLICHGGSNNDTICLVEKLRS